MRTPTYHFLSSRVLSLDIACALSTCMFIACTSAAPPGSSDTGTSVAADVGPAGPSDATQNDAAPVADAGVETLPDAMPEGMDATVGPDVGPSLGVWGSGAGADAAGPSRWGTGTGTAARGGAVWGR